MASGRGLGAWVAAALVLVLATATATVGAAPGGSEEAGKADANKAGGKVRSDEVREARQVLRDLMELGASARAEDRAGKPAKGPGNDVLRRMNRPARTVVKSSLEPAEIDELLDRSLAESKATPARLTTDEEFVRRAYLDLTGKLPTPEQVMGFVKNREKPKRAALIDHLLASRDYAENWAKYWREVVQFHVTAPNPRFVRLETLQNWLAEQFAKNTPWDEVARQMISGEGDTAEDGPAVFTAAQGAQAVELAGEVSRVFLGVQIQCAQCHDHPSDQWKREQFHQFAAFFAGVRANRGGKGSASFKVVARDGVPRYGMPDKADPTKSIPVEPKFFLAGSEATVPKGLTAPQRRELAASYITGQDNPWFARAFVNRVWYVLVGDAFYMPVDDLGPTREARAPEVLDRLAGEFAGGGYDVRWLFRTIMNTKAYQRESRSSRSTASRTPFAANCASRMRADQIVAALEGALDVDLASLMARRKAGGEAAAKKAQAKAGGALGRAFGPEQALLLLFGVDPSTPNDDVLGTIPQALFLMNNPGLNRAMSSAPGAMLGKLLASTPDDRAALEFLYLKVLGRRPNTEEVRTCDRYYLKVANRREAFEDILWALVNSTEFLSRR